jgi:dinuclear metal center YbgI/SA1388 family protein
MAVDRDKIIKYCEDYLKVKKFKDFCHNGLQIEGAKDVNKIITGVSFSEALLREAIKRKAQMVIVHHGLFTKNIILPPEITGNFRNRLKLALCNDINLAGFHLPLDAHPIIGNNISLAKLFGLKNIKPFDTPDYGEIGFIGDFAKPKLFTDFAKEVDKKLATKSYLIAAGPKQARRLGIISGGAADDYTEAAKIGADIYLCGSIRESVVENVKETKINFIHAGHYNTEKLGIQNLGNLIAKKFKIKVEFVDIPCDA